MSSDGGIAVCLYPSGTMRSILNALRFQCGPLDDLSFDSSYDHSDFMTIKAGEFSRPYGRKLRTLSLETLVVDSYPDGTYPSWVNFEQEILDGGISEALLDICENGNTFYLAAGEISHMSPFVAAVSGLPTELAGSGLVAPGRDGTRVFMPATLRSVKVTEKAGEPDTTYLTLTFAEYRDPDTVEVNNQQVAVRRGLDPLRTTRRLAMRWVGPKGTYDANGDWDLDPNPFVRVAVTPLLSLQSLAQDYYRDPSLWDRIAAANGMGAWGGSTPLCKHPLYGNNAVNILTIPAL